jgi:hypothetical protein
MGIYGEARLFEEKTDEASKEATSSVFLIEETQQSIAREAARLSPLTPYSLLRRTNP